MVDNPTVTSIKDTVTSINPFGPKASQVSPITSEQITAILSTGNTSRSNTGVAAEAFSASDLSALGIKHPMKYPMKRPMKRPLKRPSIYSKQKILIRLSFT